MKLIFSDNFRNTINIKFQETPGSGSGVTPCGQTERHDKANSRFSQFYEKRLKTTYMKQCTDDNLTEIIRSQMSEITKEYIEVGFCNKLKYNIRYKIYTIVRHQTGGVYNW